MPAMVAPADLLRLPCNPLLSGWRLSISWWSYLIDYCLPIAITLRIAHSWLRALAVRRCDFPGADRTNTIRSRWIAFVLCLVGFNRFKEHSDLWIPTAIGLFELAIYPVLLSLGSYVIIGGWIGIKTAGGWTGYSHSRTSFNRFLLFNILTLLVAFWLSPFIELLKC